MVGGLSLCEIRAIDYQFKKTASKGVIFMGGLNIITPDELV